MEAQSDEHSDEVNQIQEDVVDAVDDVDGVTNNSEALNKLFKEFRIFVSTHQTNPYGEIYKDGSYNFFAHKWAEKTRFEKDLLMAQILELSDEKQYKYVTCENDGDDNYTLTYQTFHMCEDIGDDDLDMVVVDVYADTTQKAGVLYNKDSGGRIIWLFCSLKGPVENLFEKRLFTEWIECRKYAKQQDKFSKEVVKLIRYYPNIDHPYYSTYITTFMQWFMNYEKDMSIIGNVLDSIYDGLKTIFFKNKYEEYIKEGTLEKMIQSQTTIMDIKTCSAKVHSHFSKADAKSEEAKSFLDKLKKDTAQSRVVVRQKRIPVSKKSANNKNNVNTVKSVVKTVKRKNPEPASKDTSKDESKKKLSVNKKQQQVVESKDQDDEQVVQVVKKRRLNPTTSNSQAKVQAKPKAKAIVATTVKAKAKNQDQDEDQDQDQEMELMEDKAKPVLIETKIEPQDNANVNTNSDANAGVESSTNAEIKQ